MRGERILKKNKFRDPWKKSKHTNLYVMTNTEEKVVEKILGGKTSKLFKFDIKP